MNTIPPSPAFINRVNADKAQRLNDIARREKLWIQAPVESLTRVVPNKRERRILRPVY